MKVSNNSPHKTQFGSLRMRTYDKMGNVVNCHYTNLNRADINWGKYAQFLNDRFEGQNKVKINLLGSSDCSDGYTLILNLIKVLGDKAKKFFPILVSDISEPVVKKVNDGKIQLHSRDIDFLKKMNALEFFEKDNSENVQVFNGIEFVPYTVKEPLRNRIQASVKDVRKAVKEEDFSDSVFIFRNGWTFNTLDEQNEIAKDLYRHSNEKTLVTIGQSDIFKSNASEYLQKNGFKGIETDIYTKAETDYPSKSVGLPLQKSTYPEFILFEKRGKYV